MTQGKTQTTKTKISKYDFYFEQPLYKRIDSKEVVNSNLNDLFDGEVDAWSAKNGIDTTYTITISWIRILKQERTIIEGQYVYTRSGFVKVELECKRKENDVLYFFVYYDQFNKYAIKVGQYPSLADIQFADLEKKYKKVLSKQYFDEFKKAIVSASHGYGVAAFVYLRRIFEGLIFDTFRKHKQELNIGQEEFIHQTIEEKIESLKKYLPPELLKFRYIYKILSKGIHELSEQECLAYFDALKLAVELILDNQIEAQKAEQRKQKVQQEIQKISQLVGGQK